jgi:hypothetical protein
MRRFLLVLFILSVGVNPGNSQNLPANMSKKAENSLFGKSPGKKTSGSYKARMARNAKKKQEAEKKKQHKDLEKSAKDTQKRSVEIQTPEVQARMKQDKKDTAKRDRVNKRKTRISSRKAGRKYK